jgi:UDP-N-acetylmuramoyl-tripeptide--D-alanyl-D-alanine ligase
MIRFRFESRGAGRLESTSEEVTGVQIDSRRIAGRSLRRGARRGRHLEARVATPPPRCPDDDFAAMAAIGRAVRDRSSADVVGITGSTGKTSTKDILAAPSVPTGGRSLPRPATTPTGVLLTLARLKPDTGS